MASQQPAAHLEELVARCAAGDAAALRMLYQNTAAQLFGVLKRILQRADLAEEALQDVYVSIWRSLAAGLAALAVLLGVLYVGQQGRLDRPRYVAVFTEQTTPVWVMQAFTEELRVTTVNDRPVPAGSSYELWMVPTDGTAPVSLGLIPGTGNAALPLSAQANTVLAQASALAVSVEPAGGSPTGTPTTVILSALLLRV